jgi:nucleotide-binding universal stress UspA family protein
MQQSTDLHILFPTSFSDACFQAGRAIAQLADTLRVNLVIAHVVRRGGATSAVRRELDSFFGEGDHFDSCRRVIIESNNAPQAIADYARRGFDLLVSPASDRLGLHRILVPSFRGRLMRQANVPLWTVGASVSRTRFQRPIRNVAYLVDYHVQPGVRLPLVTSFASRFDADLHVLDVIPDISEGSLVLDSDRPLNADVSSDRMRALFKESHPTRVHVATGTRRGELRRMLERCDADVLFIGQEQASRGLFFPRFARDLDRLPCPVVCLGRSAESLQGWSFERHWIERYDIGNEDLVLAG